LIDILQTVVAFIVALGVLITVHEYGHFWVARRCGVRVIKFSVGFGPTLFSWKGKTGTEYALSAIPFGGFVKMLGESIGSEITDEERSESFAHKSVYQRIAIVFAGPFVNLVFAVFIYWLIFVTGIVRVAPIVGELVPGGPADIAGIQTKDEIVAVDGNETISWSSVSFYLVSRIGESGTIEITTKVAETDQTQVHRVTVDQWMSGVEKEGPLAALGVDIFRPELPVLIGELVPEKAAIRDGLLVGDRVISAQGELLTHWVDWVKMIKEHPGKPMQIEILRNDALLSLSLTPDAIIGENGKSYGQIGAIAAPESVKIPDGFIRYISYSPLEAIPEALKKTRNFIALTLTSIKKMITGDIALDNLSGPITIAKIAGDTASYGLEPFLSFVAYLSISLGVLNLLPIPVLDGGHLMFYLAEVLKGGPVSEKIQSFSNSLGVALLVLFMGLAFYNDLIGL